MENADKVYVELQKHLDKQAVGFPATKSGVEIRILKHLFNPEQAGIALHLNYKPQSASQVYNSAKGSGMSLIKVEGLLEQMLRNGAIGSTERKGAECYFTIPLLIGIAELHEHNATPQFWADFGEYMSSGFGRAFASTKVSQMRTIPVEKSIPVEHHVTTYDRIREIINNTDGPIVLYTCMCREGAKEGGQPCNLHGLWRLGQAVRKIRRQSNNQRESPGNNAPESRGRPCPAADQLPENRFCLLVLRVLLRRPENTKGVAQTGPKLGPQLLCCGRGGELHRL
jgi:hypothetical protein